MIYAVVIAMAVALISLIGAAVWLMKKGEAAGRRNVLISHAQQETKILQERAKIDAKPMDSESAISILDRLARKSGGVR